MYEEMYPDNSGINDIMLNVKVLAIVAWEDFCDGLMELRMVRMNEQKWVAYIVKERNRFMDWETPEWCKVYGPG